ncbi:hypothetical protein [Caloramator sp. Dgby_cultured_2]|uniref:hypothetical protein n=1 Tax=Caloramator sp. Dgby_cultured_2 TaxID=3029174 RepID=UPI00237D77CC|nr:hypothetical protein [Caloramator sp. Dgby_cultured_2]WDU82466.1 hypothetical protein PWK10_12625 [Caloramator sp. Dgby_cultured_2]
MVLLIGISFHHQIQDVLLKAQNKDLPELSIDEKLEDFDYLYNVLKDNYPYLEVSKRKTGFDWLEKREEFKGTIAKTKTMLNFILPSMRFYIFYKMPIQI